MVFGCCGDLVPSFVKEMLRAQNSGSLVWSLRKYSALNVGRLGISKKLSFWKVCTNYTNVIF